MGLGRIAQTNAFEVICRVMVMVVVMVMVMVMVRVMV